MILTSCYSDRSHTGGSDIHDAHDLPTGERDNLNVAEPSQDRRRGAEPDDRGGRSRRADRDPRPSRRAPVRRAAAGAFGRSLGKWIGIAIVGGLFATIVIPYAFSRLPNPFATRTIDRTEPPILQAIADLHRYEAASATFEVVVDIEKDAKFLPDAIRGERRIMLAHGTVDAGIDFADLRSSISVDEPAKSVVITVPHARLTGIHIDMSRSRMLEHTRGLLDRLGSTFGGAPAGDQDLFRIAEQKLEAAAGESGVLRQAETNTESMLTQLATGLGYRTITIRFADGPPRLGPPAPSDARMRNTTAPTAVPTIEP